MPKDGPTRNVIRDFIAENGSATSRELADRLGITRQAVSLHLRRLLADGEIFKTGSTRAARYFARQSAPPERCMKRELALADLDESAVYEELAITLTLSRLPDNAAHPSIVIRTVNTGKAIEAMIQHVVTIVR